MTKQGSQNNLGGVNPLKSQNVDVSLLDPLPPSPQKVGIAFKDGVITGLSSDPLLKFHFLGGASRNYY